MLNELFTQYIPQADSIHEVTAFATDYAGVPVALETASICGDEAEAKLIAAGIRFSYCYIAGYVIDAADVEKVMDAFELNILELSYDEETYFEVVRHSSADDFSDNSGYSTLMYEMLQQADCFRMPLDEVFAEGERDDENKLHPYMRNGRPDLGI